MDVRSKAPFGMALLVGVALLAGACGGGTSSGGGGGGGSDAAPAGNDAAAAGDVGTGKLVVTFDVEGEIDLKGTVTDTVLPTTASGMEKDCADYAGGGKANNGKPMFILPLKLGGDLSGKNVSLQVNVRDYTGPGNYTEDKLYAEGVSFGVLVDDRPYVAQGDDSGSIVTTEANGAGQFYFEKLAYSTGGDTSPGISGQISWTCED
jgi:hypothetical protein